MKSSFEILFVGYISFDFYLVMYRNIWKVIVRYMFIKRSQVLLGYGYRVDMYYFDYISYG